MTSKGVGDPPEWMNDEGREVWAFLTAELGDQLTAVDRPAFTLMCSKYGEAEEASKDVHKRGVLVKGRSKDHSADDTDDDGDERPAQVKNPAVQVARDAMNQFLAYAKEFGLTPGARKRMQMELGKKSGGGAKPAID